MAALLVPTCDTTDLAATHKQSVFDCLTGSGRADHVEYNVLLSVFKLITGREFRIDAADGLTRARNRAVGLLCSPSAAVTRGLVGISASRGHVWETAVIQPRTAESEMAVTPALPKKQRWFIWVMCVLCGYIYFFVIQPQFIAQPKSHASLLLIE
jgi:hypothetical protein